MMLTIKKRGSAVQFLSVILAASLTACGPAGPRDLRKGQHLIERGRYSDAVPVLNEAVELLHDSPAIVQANAWNLLGLAYHGAGRQELASHAYLQALQLDRNLWAADYNLGCLRLEQTNYPGAIDYLTTYTTSHPKDANGYLLLGRARYEFGMEHSGSERSWQLDSAKLDFEYAETLHGSAEACNALGLIALQRRAPGADSARVAVDFFRRALQSDSHYPPALLNLAIVLQRYSPKEALATYREYLALDPEPPQAKEVEKVAHQLDLDIRITIIPHVEQRPAPAPTTPASPTAPTVPATSPQPVPATPMIAKTTPVASVETPEETQVPPENPPPAIATPSPATTYAPATANLPPSVNSTGPQNPEIGQPEEKKSSLAHKLNPLTWFGKSKKEDTNETQVAENGNNDHYVYPLPITPIPGDRQRAETLLSEGRQAERQSNLAEAMRDYKAAITADPSYFDAGLALGLAAIDAKDYPAASNALSQSLTLDANSADARYAYAWVLGRQGNYQDAVNELDRLLAAHPKEVRARLLLGNYYADNLDQPKLARDQYLKALELIDPHSSQANVIRAWLDQHP